MDVRFYPPPAQAAPAPDTPCLGPSPCLDPYYCNKFDGDNMYMSMSEPNQDYVPASQTYPGHSLENEDFNIPPITPPSMPEHALVPLSEAESGYSPLCHPMNQNGLLQFHPQNMDLPAITVSNMLSQDGSLISNSLAVMQDLQNSERSQYSSHTQMAAMRPRVQPQDIRQTAMMQHGQLTTINQSQLSAQLGLNIGGNTVAHNSPSPPGSKSATPSPSSSVHEDEVEDTAKVYKKKTEAAKKEYLKQLAAYRASLVSKSYSEPIDVKSSQPSQMMTSKPPVFHGPTQQHSTLYLNSPYHQQSTMNPHLSAMHPGINRNIAPKPSNQMPVTVSLASMAVSPPPSLQMSPPLHQHMHMQQHQTMSMQQSIGSQLQMQSQSALHSPAMQQGFSLQSEYQNLISPTSTAAQVVTQAMEYVRSGCRNPPGQAIEWNNDYCSNGNMQRDKALYLT
ncbi:hypothetical protein GDO81_011417 [Engystomops pustulosus]|uniref:Thymocyte selection associated high mobility group box n=1 Tax=Engystomops pustulosus TaxID=76066 RepID=A0AAV7BE57_ENGPU|nr:hypothetical protein GDO81_011417 [Engystomops pustulosus]